MEKQDEYRKLCIINHATHNVLIECVPVSLLDKDYGGEEEAYIRDMFDFTDEEWKNGLISWDWFVDIGDYTDDTLELDLPDLELYNKF